MRFPTVKGSNLERDKVILPQDLKGDLNVVLVAFQQWQQNSIDTWLAPLEGVERERVGLKVYELPVIQRINRLYQMVINEGMRAGIPDRRARQRTITLYLDKTSFRRALGMADEDDIYVLLLDRQGQILWRTRGRYAADKAAGLIEAIDAAQFQQRAHQALDQVINVYA
jgi:hypothetical protein